MRAAPGPGRAAFPAMLGAEQHAQYGQEFHPLDPRRAPPVGPALDDYPAQYSAPSMRNPFDAPVAVTEPEAVPLSPQPYPFPTPPRTAPEPRFAPEQRYATEPRTVFEARVGADFGEPARSAAPAAPYGANGSGVAVRQAEPESRPAPPPPRRQAAAFDAMWPAETHPAEPPPFKSGESRPAAEAQAPAPGQAAPQPRNVNELRPVAVLKSGMVDGMGYTLYVDGSIEADLPQGTVRFASINDLRNHLEKNS